MFLLFGLLMNNFKELIDSFIKESGMQIELEQDDSFSLERDGLLVTVKYIKETDDITLFVPIIDHERIPELTPPVLKAALKLSFNGIGTSGNYLGLFDNALILSTGIPLRDLDSEKLAERLFLFSDAAIAVRDSIINEIQDDDQPIVTNHTPNLSDLGLAGIPV